MTTPTYTVSRIGTCAVSVIANTADEAREGIKYVENQIGRQTVWTGPNYKRTGGWYEAVGVLDTEDTI